MMEVLLKISLIILLVYILIQALNIFSLLYVDNDRPDKILSDEELPSISILISARNEE